MTGEFEFAVIKIEDSRRNECLNAGIVVFGAESLEVVLPRRLDKLKSLSGALDLDLIRTDIEYLHFIDAEVRCGGAKSARERLEMMVQLTPFAFSPISCFMAHNVDAYSSSVKKILEVLVEPEPGPPKVYKKKTRLVSILRSVLRSERVLARKGEGLSTHRVVPNLQIVEGLSADLVLRNGAMHVIETVDASADDASLRKIVSDIAISALVLEQARMTFGESQTKARLVYEASASAERVAMPSLEAAANQGAELINWASLDDRNGLIVQLTSLAEPFPTKRRHKFDSLNASTQRRFDLN